MKLASWMLVLTIAVAATAAGRQLPRTSDLLDQDHPPVSELVLRELVQRDLRGGETHDYRLVAAAGQFVRVFVEQRSINVVVSVFEPGGNRVMETNTTGSGDVETATFITSVSGEYRIRVGSVESDALSGRYAIKLDDVEPPTEQHRSRVAAERAFSDGMAFYYQQHADTTRQAIQQFEQARISWHTANDAAGEAKALYMMGRLYIDLADKDKALDFTTKALAVARAAGDRAAEAWALDFIGQVYENFGDRKTALDYYHQALPLRRGSGDRVGEGNTLNNLGMAYARLGEKRTALRNFEEAVSIYRALQDRRRQATLLSNIGVTYAALGEYQSALESYNRALALHRQMANRAGEAISLNNIGAVYRSLGEYQKALDAFTAAQLINRALGSRQNEAVNLNGIALTYATLGDEQHALEFYSEASTRFRAVGDLHDLAVTLSNMGVAYAHLGEYRKALDLHREALPLRRTVGDRDGEAMTLTSAGDCYAKLGERAQALEHYQQALAIHRAAGNRQLLADTLRNLGTLARESGDGPAARAYLDEAGQASRTIGDRKGEGAALVEIARLELDQNHLDEARSDAEEALAAYESLRLGVASPQLRASFFASVRAAQELDINALMRLHATRPTAGFDVAALVATERGRARSLLELLAESRSKIRQGVDPALLDQERSLQAALADRAERQVRLLTGVHTVDDAREAAKEIATLTLEYEQVQSRIRETSPRYAALTVPVPLTLPEIQELLDEETVLLDYALGQDSSYLFAVTRASLSSYQLPKRAVLETAATHVYDLLTARNRAITHETPEQRLLRIRRADAAFPAAADALSQTLLRPIGRQLAGKRLLIVAEGALLYLPFAALPDPFAEARGRTWQPLIVGHEVVTVPSASVLAALRRETPPHRASDKRLAVLADAVFDTDDVRVAQARRARLGGRAEPSADALRSANESGLQRFARLRFSRQEGERIARMVPSAETLTAFDFAANRATVMSSELSRYRIVHFATHGLINNQHPELSGIVLSLVNQKGEPVDGFVRLYDIYNLQLEADLVVLSACQTALGPEISGEGLIGLTRGFMYAGVPRIVASLWQIDDRATSELMTRFYEPMLRRGERPADALRAAQTAMWQSKGWESPYYWAAFTLQGEWK